MNKLISGFAVAVLLASPIIALADDMTVQPTGGTMPYCSGPMAPGWVASLPGGGCGSTETFFASGQTIVFNGKSVECPWWFPSGCVIQ